jgi:2-polyprenyl-3-methyl-5-hydroxy-6-metoxy-1,4-benzoquinol methylase
VRAALRGIEARLRPPPALRYVHPKAKGLTEADAEASLHLDTAEDRMPNHLRWIADLCRPYLGQRVLDVGAGTGTITAQYADGRDVVAVDSSASCVAELHRRFARTPNVRVEHADLREFQDERGFDAIVMINVLEHIDDDVATLQSLSRLLQPRGRIVLYVPALNGLYGRFDRRVGHYRRYAPWRMRAVVQAAGFQPLVLRYVNALALPGWLLAHSSADRPELPVGMRLWDQIGVPVTRVIESHVRLPFGLNVFCVAHLRT